MSIVLDTQLDMHSILYKVICCKPALPLELVEMRV